MKRDTDIGKLLAALEGMGISNVKPKGETSGGTVRFYTAEYSRSQVRLRIRLMDGEAWVFVHAVDPSSIYSFLSFVLNTRTYTLVLRPDTMPMVSLQEIVYI